MQKLLSDSGIKIPEEGSGLPEIQKFQQFLVNYQIVVYMFDATKSRKKDVLFKGPDVGKRLNLIYYEGHYSVISNLNRAFCAANFCENCDLPYDNYHKCKKSCFACHQTPPCIKTVNKIKCDVCNREFLGPACFDHHFKNETCKKYKRCTECLRCFLSERTHVCEEFKCPTCKTIVPQEHLCFMKPDTGSPIFEKFLYVFFDFETMQEDVIGEKVVEGVSLGAINRHVVNLCVFQLRCFK